MTNGDDAKEHPLASGFSLADGEVTVEIPAEVESGENYFIVCGFYHRRFLKIRSNSHFSVLGDSVRSTCRTSSRS